MQNCRKDWRYHRDQYLRKKFGIGLSQYEAMNDRQNGKCWICKQYNDSGRELAVDHCHSSSKVRGLLCGRCNTTLGKIGDDVELLRRMIEYLTKNHILPDDIEINPKCDDDKPRWRKIFHTPDGTFISGEEVGRFYGVSDTTVSHWCGAYKYSNPLNIKEGFSIEKVFMSAAEARIKYKDQIKCLD